MTFLFMLMASASLAQEMPPSASPSPPPPAGRSVPGRPDDRPRALFISPMGEPFRVEHPDQAWFAGVDANKDGRIDRAEFRADAARFFRTLDRQGDGEIDPQDVERYETDLVPEIRVPNGNGPGGPAGGRRGPPPGGPGGGRGGAGGPPPGGGPPGRGPGNDEGESGSRPAARAGARGAARYGYLDLPQPITSADASLNRGVDPAEFERAANQRFAQLDRNDDGVIARGELPPVDTRMRGGPHGRQPGPPPGD